MIGGSLRRVSDGPRAKVLLRLEIEANGGDRLATVETSKAIGGGCFRLEIGEETSVTANLATGTVGDDAKCDVVTTDHAFQFLVKVRGASNWSRLTIGR